MSYNPRSGENLKHPTDTELLNPAKDTLPGEKTKQNKTKTVVVSPCNPVMVEALFFSYTNIDKSCVHPSSENTMCPLYTENFHTWFYIYGLLSAVIPLFTVRVT